MFFASYGIPNGLRAIVPSGHACPRDRRRQIIMTLRLMSDLLPVGGFI
ncbi:hypothetical protein [Trichothermofontia sp.]